MPTIARLSCCTLTMYVDDHPPPHFHVRMRDGREALISIRNLAVLSGTLMPRELLEARAWAERNASALLTRWRELNP